VFGERGLEVRYSLGPEKRGSRMRSTAQGGRSEQPRVRMNRLQQAKRENKGGEKFLEYGKPAFGRALKSH